MHPRQRGQLKIIDAAERAVVVDAFGLVQPRYSAMALSEESPTLPMEASAPASTSRSA